MEPIKYNFNVEGIDPFVAGGQPLPGGWYLMHIVEMACKANRDQSTGHNLSTELAVLEGEHKGRKMFDNLNLWYTGANAEKTVEIAMKQLSSIGHAVGVTSGDDLTLLALKPMLVEVELQEAKPDTINPNTGETVKGRGPSNRILQRKQATAENIALHLNKGGVPVPQVQQQMGQATQAAAAAQAPAFNPAQAQAAAPAPQASTQAPPPFAAPQAAAAPAAAPAGGTTQAPPPWQR